MIRNILIADDDSDLARVIARRCMHLGYRVSIAEDGLSAIVLLKHDLPDLVLLDIDLPCGNGLGVLELIRATPEWQDVPVIIVSGRNERDICQRLEAGRVPFVHKNDQLWDKLEPRIGQILHDAPHVGSPKPKGVAPRDRASEPQLMA